MFRWRLILGIVGLPLSLANDIVQLNNHDEGHSAYHIPKQFHGTWRQDSDSSVVFDIRALSINSQALVTAPLMTKLLTGTFTWDVYAAEPKPKTTTTTTTTTTDDPSLIGERPPCWLCYRLELLHENVLRIQFTYKHCIKVRFKLACIDQ